MDVKERHEVEAPVVRGELERRGDVPGRGREVGLGERHQLRTARRARGVQQQREVVGDRSRGLTGRLRVGETGGGGGGEEAARRGGAAGRGPGGGAGGPRARGAGGRRGSAGGGGPPPPLRWTRPVGSTGRRSRPKVLIRGSSSLTPDRG